MELLISEVLSFKLLKIFIRLPDLDDLRNGFMKGAIGLEKYMKFIIGHCGTSSSLVYASPLRLSRVNRQAPTSHP